jgi:hypothetical protein
VEVSRIEPLADQEKYLKIYDQYAPLWSLLDKQTSEKLRKRNYERIFDEARRRVKAWGEALPESRGSLTLPD